MVPRADPEPSPRTVVAQDYFYLQSPGDHKPVDQSNNLVVLPVRAARPDTHRRSTDPCIAAPPPAHLHNEFPLAHSRPRNRSPYSRSHLRSRSGSSLTAPPIARAHSLPTVQSPRHSTSSTLSPAYTPPYASSSPQRSPRMGSPRIGSPSRHFQEYNQSAGSSPSMYDGGFEIISEDSELDLTHRAQIDRVCAPSPLHSSLSSARTLAGRRQRPTSPLHSLGITSGTPSTSSNFSSSASSPSLAPARFNEGFPALHHSGSNSSFSSMPSTPTSTRSRSPSVSSLETIEDAPDLEWEAVEAERAARFKNDNGEIKPRRSSLDTPGPRPGAGFGFGRAGDRNRKRWSICGGERRADLDLETIWED